MQMAAWTWGAWVCVTSHEREQVLREGFLEQEEEEQEEKQ